MAAKTGKSMRAQETIRALGGADANPRGRPRTSVGSLPADWKEIMLVEARDGGGPTAFMVKLGISHTAYDTLISDSEDFRNTLGSCLLLCKYWWEHRGRDMANGSDGNSAVWSLNMTNRFNWRSGRNEVIGDKTAPVQIETKNQNLTKEELIAELVLRGLPTSIFKD